MGLVTGTNGIIKTSDIKEELDYSKVAEIADGEWEIVGNDDLTASVQDEITVKANGVDKCLLKTRGNNYLLIRKSNLPHFYGFSGQSLTPKTGEAHLIRVGDSFDCENKDVVIDTLNLIGYGYSSNGSGAIWTRGKGNGLIHSINFNNEPEANGDRYGIQLDGDNVYTTDTSKYLGPDWWKHLWVIEDCVFSGCRHGTCEDRGMAAMVRRCTFKNGVVGQQIDSHGGNGSYQVGTVLLIACNNTIETPVSGNWKALMVRGGQVFAHDNIANGYRNFLEFTLEGNTRDGAKSVLYKPHHSYVWNNGPVDRVVVYDHNYLPGYTPSDYIREGQEYFLNAPASSIYTPFGEHPLRTAVTPTPVPPDPEPEPAGNTTFKIFVNGDISGELIIGPDIGMTGHLSANIDISNKED